MTDENDNDARLRMSPEDRRRQLLRVTSNIIATDGLESVRIPYVAAAAGVTRPVVYKFFPNRSALIHGVLEDFKDTLQARLPEINDESTADKVNTTRLFVNTACDVIEETGAGGWLLLGAIGHDPETEAMSREMLDALFEPWMNAIKDITGSPRHQNRALAQMLASSVRAVISLWMRGELTREEVVQMLMRSIVAVLREFSRTDV